MLFLMLVAMGILNRTRFISKEQNKIEILKISDLIHKKMTLSRHLRRTVRTLELSIADTIILAIFFFF